MTEMNIRNPMKPLNTQNLKNFFMNINVSPNIKKSQHEKANTQNLILKPRNIKCPNINNKLLDNTTNISLDPHEEKVKKNLERYKKVLNEKFNSSVVNRTYVFPRTSKVHEVSYTTPLVASIYDDVVEVVEKRNHSLNEVRTKGSIKIKHGKFNREIKKRVRFGLEKVSEDECNFNKTLVFSTKNRLMRNFINKSDTPNVFASAELSTKNFPLYINASRNDKVSSTLNKYVVEFPILKNINIKKHTKNKTNLLIKTKLKNDKLIRLGLSNVFLKEGYRVRSKLDNYKADNDFSYWNSSSYYSNQHYYKLHMN